MRLLLTLLHCLCTPQTSKQSLHLKNCFLCRVIIINPTLDKLHLGRPLRHQPIRIISRSPSQIQVMRTFSSITNISCSLTKTNSKHIKRICYVKGYLFPSQEPLHCPICSLKHYAMH
ncbi:hypothetical protein Hanom_Chr09g00858871 [Helianthus anomalus]